MVNYVYVDVRLEDTHRFFAQGFQPVPVTQPTQLYRAKKDALTVTLFSSGKLVLQAPESADIHGLCKGLLAAPSPKKKPAKQHLLTQYNTLAVLGSDETLKGDTFGGLIVCGFFYSPELEEPLTQLGVRDSKQLATPAILRIAAQLQERYAQRIFLQALTPQDYNQQLTLMSSTQLLNHLHKEVAILKPPEALHVVDAYPGCTVGDVQLTHAETSSLAVAAASILARAKALEQFDELSKQAGFQLPLGSTHVRLALDRLLAAQQDLSRFAKLHFSNVQTALKARNST